jgi:hypothetical protein
MLGSLAAAQLIGLTVERPRMSRTLLRGLSYTKDAWQSLDPCVVKSHSSRLPCAICHTAFATSVDENGISKWHEAMRDKVVSHNMGRFDIDIGTKD